MRRTFAVACIVAVFLATGAEPARGRGTWVRPVAGRIVEPFRAPRTRFGPGHVGVDFSAARGTPVHAAGPGTVAFAGLVAGARYVVIRHAGGLRTTYAFLASIGVRTGEALTRGAVVGTTGGRGENHEPGVLHFGLRIADAYVDPMQLFAADADPTDLTALVHLAPLDPAPLDEARSWAAGPVEPRPPVELRPPVLEPDPGADGARVAVPVGGHRVAL
jgi:murein DD-endopeptidase MepM/ murein hydrolase activator NlpD